MQTTLDRRAPGTCAASPRPVDDEQRLRILFDGNPAAVLLVDGQGRIVDANPSVQAHFGYEPLALRGEALSVLIPDWDRPDSLAELARCTQPHSATLRHAQDRRCDVVVTLLPATAGGTAGEGGYFLVVRDVTAQRRDQRQMQVQSEILARSHEAMAVLDEVGRVLCWNAAAERLYGASAQAMIGQPFTRLFEEPGRARLHQAMDDTCLDASLPTELELCRTGPQGQEAVLRLSLSRTAGVERGRELLVVQAQDISERIRAERAERSAQTRELRREQHEQRLIRSAANMGRQLGRKALLQHLAEVARARIGAHQSAIWLLDGPEGGPAVRAVSTSTKYPAWRGAGAGLFGSQALACLAWRVLDQGAMAQMHDLQIERHLTAAPDKSSLPQRVGVTAPMFDRDGRAIGLLQLCDRYEGDFDEHDLAEMQQLAKVVSAALDASLGPETAWRCAGVPQ